MLASFGFLKIFKDIFTTVDILTPQYGISVVQEKIKLLI
jgi:hypothetical protein